MAMYRLEFWSLRPNELVTANKIADDEAKAIAWAKQKYTIQRDSLRVFPVHEDDAAAVKELEKSLKRPIADPFVGWEDGRVVGLDLGVPLCAFEDSTTDAQIEPVARLRCLRELSLRGCLKITDKGLKIVRSLKRLESLILDEMQIGDDCSQNLSGLVALKELYLGKATFKDQNVTRRGYFTDAGLRKLNKLANLFAVSLDYSEVTGAGLDTFESLQTWEHFGCTYSAFNDGGMKNIARMPKLKKLDLSYTQITSAGLVHVKNLKLLEDLYMDGTKITDEGLQHLRALKRLRYLNFADTLVTPKAAKAAQRRLASQ